MNTHTNRKVVCIKDIPSNLIEEAIFILKADDIDDKGKKSKISRHEIILKETEDLVREYTDEFSKKKIKDEMETKQNRDIKLKVILGATLLALVCYLISMIITIS